MLVFATEVMVFVISHGSRTGGVLVAVVRVQRMNMCLIAGWTGCCKKHEQKHTSRGQPLFIYLVPEALSKPLC
jgi:hypothetical protein